MIKPLLLLITIFFSVGSFAKADVNHNDLTEFDYPLIIGDWYWFNSYSEGELSPDQYQAINFQFSSNYQFTIRVLRGDDSIDQWQGKYDLDDSMVLFAADGEEPQLHSYHVNHHQLKLNGINFTKIAPEFLAGHWKSSMISGDDITASKITEMVLSLRPDFLFSVQVSSDSGDQVTHLGIYYLEDDHLVLIYKEGQHDSQYELAADQLILKNEQFDTYAVLERSE